MVTVRTTMTMAMVMVVLTVAEVINEPKIERVRWYQVWHDQRRACIG